MKRGQMVSLAQPLPGASLPASTSSVGGQPATVSVAVTLTNKSLFEAWILAFTLGILGAHHFYLRRTWFGVAYLLTGGLFGVGYLVDLFRMPCLVRQANLALQQPGLKDVKTKVDAYLLWFPCGLLGFHYFYLRKPAFGVLYFFTLGLGGLGWLVDAFRMPWLVREANERLPPYELQEKDSCLAYILAISPLGVLGGHHYYLNRPIWGLLYSFTLGLGGVGWLGDWARTWNLVRRANRVAAGLDSPDRKYVDDAYFLWFPLGFLGLHHFYLGRHGWGCLYFFTGGLMGLGWLFDACRLPSLVRETNLASEQSQRLLRSGAESQSALPAIRIIPAGYPGHSYAPPSYGVYPQNTVTTVSPSPYWPVPPVPPQSLIPQPPGDDPLPPPYEEVLGSSKSLPPPGH